MKAAMRRAVQCRNGVVGMHSLSRSWRYPLAMLIKFGGAKWGANVGRRQATQGDTRRRSVQLAGITSDNERRLATVRLRLTSEGSLVRTQLRPRILLCGTIFRFSNVHLGVGRGPDAIGFLSPA
jgi:hypothetical protein